MKDFNTKLITALAQGESVHEIFRQALEEAINLLLESERTVFLNYEKCEVKGYNTGNYRNGYYSRTLNTEYGKLQLKIPRDRLGLFDIKTLQCLQQAPNHLEKMIILMYQKGVTTRDISDLIEKMYGHHYSPTTISHLSKTFEEELAAYRQRPIKQDYVCLYCDATFIPVRRGSVSKEAVHTIIGIDAQGYKEILDFQVYPTESSLHYREMLQDLKQRGLENVFLFVSDELTGLAEALTNEFPMALHQTCWTHLLRHFAMKVRVKDRQEVLEELKKVPKAGYIVEATRLLNEFIQTWKGTYPKLVEQLRRKKNLFSFMHFPKEIWPSLYTNNLSEAFNKQLKKRTKIKEQFPHEASLEKTVYCYVIEYNAKFANRIHKGFGKVAFELQLLIDFKRPVNEFNLGRGTEKSSSIM